MSSKPKTSRRQTPAEDLVFHATVGFDGIVRLPREVRERYGIKRGDRLSITATASCIRVQTLDQSIKAAQEYFRSFAPGRCLSEELIAERRREAEAQEREFQRDSRMGHTAALPPKRPS